MERRSFLKTAFIGSAVTVLSGCGGGNDTEAPVQQETAALECNDLTGLTESEINARTNLNYVDVTPKPGQVCDNCAFWAEGATATACGTCTVVKGPIAPKGYCITWAAKQS